ncbi:SCO3933 family regulatory protein [Streptomyces mirabilis]|uniref:SCO3933 family regulatory protein n=1 Tax=Streptomyces mirabilis TaxID=68239 RepID=UPI0036ACA870
MQSIPVDTARLGVLRCAIAPEAKISNFETQEVKKDRDGNTVYSVAVTVRQDGRRISVIEIAVAGEPKGIEEGQILKVTGLTAFAWAMGDRHGISFRADAITPVPNAPVPNKTGGA